MTKAGAKLSITSAKLLTYLLIKEGGNNGEVRVGRRRSPCDVGFSVK